jgi:predicted DNA-binding protein YlxM (UPF0122 family)
MLPELLEQFNASRHALFERKKIRSFELFLSGAQTYLNTLNEGEQKSEIVEKLGLQLQHILEGHIGENKLQIKVPVASVLQVFLTKADRVAKKIFS